MASWLRGFVAPAFTLVEMLVSIAVLIVALTIVGVVFSVTTKTATQAAALAEVQALVREWELQITEDLKYCEPSQSVLTIVGRTQAAALTQDQLDARQFYRVLVGDPGAVPNGFEPDFFNGTINPTVQQYSNPRADLLMFITNRSGVSQAPPTNVNPSNPAYPYFSGAKFSPLLVTYGHASFGNTVPLSGGGYQWSNDVRHISQTIGGANNQPNLQSGIPANQWHVARRALIIESPPAVGLQLPRPADPADYDRFCRCQATNDEAGDVTEFNWNAFLSFMSLPGAIDNDRQPYVFPTNQGVGRAAEILQRLYCYGNQQDYHIATILENPPLELRSNLGLHMLPGCAWFQVEFLMPEDPRNSLDYYNPDPAGLSGVDFSDRYDTPRWTEVEAGHTYVFLPDTPENREIVALSDPTPGAGRLGDFALLDPTGANTIANRRIRLWPYAIRITVRVFDPRNRLPEPVIRTVVHRFE